jgi:hypothetical protein
MNELPRGDFKKNMTDMIIIEKVLEKYIIENILIIHFLKDALSQWLR